MKRVLLVVLVASMVVVAGCGGGNGTAEDIGSDDPEDPGADDDPSETDDDTGDDDVHGGDDGTEPPRDVDGELELHHLDVGQADSTLIVTPNDETILIDTGDWRQDGADVIAYLEDEGIDRVDHLVATHAHADHIGGHAAVIEHFEEHGDGIGTIYDSGVPHDSATYENYLDTVDEYGHELVIVEEGDELPLGDDAVGAHVINPPAEESGDDLHYNSVSLVFEFGEFSYVTTGDAETDAEDRMVDEGADDLDGTVYHAGHHGSTTSSTQPFMDAVDPEITVISSGYDSQFGHPHTEVLERFAAMGIETYWTGVHGDIVVTTDGESVAVDTADAFSTDPEDLLEERPDDEDEDAEASIAGQPPTTETTAAPTPE